MSPPANLIDVRHAVVFSGYCAPASIGGQLQALGGLPVEERRLHTGELEWRTPNGCARLAVADIAAEIGLLSGYSAHADQAGLEQWAFWRWQDAVRPVGRTVFLQHGEDQQRAALADALKATAEREDVALDVICPAGEPVWLDLERGAEAVHREIEEESLQAQIRALQDQLRKVRGLGRAGE